MSRQTFLTISAPIACIVGLVALFYPSLLLISKGVVPDEPVKVWMTEVGILLLSMGVILFLVRKQPDSITMKALLFGNMLIQLGLLVIEIQAFLVGTITDISGIIPNSILHVLLVIGFFYYWMKLKTNH
ncbi:MAG: hypothetical protein CMP48_27315 [Rickettsiales bacterium]|nr:hypothetical protein [Rickettsiales bacterium]